MYLMVRVRARLRARGRRGSRLRVWRLTGRVRVQGGCRLGYIGVGGTRAHVVGSAGE